VNRERIQLTVLVIDDEQIIRSLAHKILARAGHQVLLAESGTQAVDLVTSRGHDIHLVLLDLRMEGMSGIETLQRIRELLPNLPCIISSGQPADVGDVPHNLRSGLLFLQKPYRAQDLRDKVQQIAAVPSVEN
jgi:two-component system cell cycle sensor histidine kinase/response regulator CckA